jgi:hypothetical protein
MSKIVNMYKSFFGIAEQTDKPGAIKLPKTSTPQDIKKYTDDGFDVELEEAQLVNHITDYKGGVQYMLRDAAMANNVAQEIRDFAAKKKIYIIRHTKSRDGRFGYFHFRLGLDPAKESQQLQGYLSQKPEIKHFRFKLLGQPKQITR